MDFLKFLLLFLTRDYYINDRNFKVDFPTKLFTKKHFLSCPIEQDMISNGIFDNFYTNLFTEKDISKVNLEKKVIIFEHQQRDTTLSYVDMTNINLSSNKFEIFLLNYKLIDFLYSGFGPQLNPNLFPSLNYFDLFWVPRSIKP